MEIENSPLSTMASVVIKNGTSSVVSYTAIISILVNTGNAVPDTNYVKPLQISNVTIVRDYVHNLADVITCTMQIPIGQYTYLLYPNRAQFEVTLMKARKSITGEDLTSNNYESEKFYGFLVKAPNPATIANGSEMIDMGTLDLKGTIDIHFQLVSEAVTKLKAISFSTIVRDVALDDLLETVLPTEMTSINIDSNLALQDFELSTIDNETVYPQIVFPTGFRLIDMPDYLQDMYGLYNAGMGSYIQNRTWYVFPLYDNSDYEVTLRTITFIILPKKKFNGIEHTYMVNQDTISILITSDTKFKDDAGTGQYNSGNGVRYTDANTVVDGSGTTGGNKITIKRSDNVSEYLLANNPKGINVVSAPTTNVTSNPFKANSEMTSRIGGNVRLTWQNSDPSIILPSMKCKIVYFDDNQVKEIYGVILKTQNATIKNSDIQSTNYVTTSVIDIFIQTLPVNTDNSKVDGTITSTQMGSPNALNI